MTSRRASVEGATFPALGTSATVLVTDPAALGRARELLERELAAIDAACSRFRVDSELARVNAAAGRPVLVSPLFATALEAALRAALITDGDVDPTCGQALVNLGYDRDFTEVTRDTGRTAGTATPLPGWQAVRLDWPGVTGGHGVVQVRRGVMLDLGATAKALAADRAAAAISETLGCGVLVNLGGDIALGGPAPRSGWRVLVTDDHAAGTDAPGQAISVRSGGIATSSTTVRTWDMAGRRVHHIVAPTTGAPARSCWRTASVAAGSCVDANTASTAAIIRAQAAPAWLADMRLPARLVGTDGSVVTVAGWPEEGTGQFDGGHAGRAKVGPSC
ncbi:MAG: FAD:protein FMN transferase [Micromonosporaceae bacterium]